jgi:dihydroorotate dehydrogenase
MFTSNIIGLLYKQILKPVFFTQDPELVHDKMIQLGNLLGKYSFSRNLTRLIFRYDNPILSQEICGLKFPNPVGLSAGFDKNAKLLNILPCVGFGLAEIGSVTHNAYQGNPKPRLFRLPKSKGLVVYYGLMNDGVKALAPKFTNHILADTIIGMSIAKTNCVATSTEEGGIQDYFECLKYATENNLADYYTINISCPNTFGGEPFTSKEKLEKLLSKLSEVEKVKPIFVKMPINLNMQDFDDLLNCCIKYKIDGVVIGNLTKVRDTDLIKDEIPENVKGGISGMPTQKLSNDLISYTYKKYGDKLIIIGVGGIFSAEDAYEKIKLGASLLQLITGMIYEGPGLIGEINEQLVRLLQKDGYTNLSEAIGAFHL